MHKYMRAIGFSSTIDRRKLQKLITDVIVNSDYRNYATISDSAVLAEFDKEYAPGMGIAVCGEFDEDNNFTYDYYYPYLSGSQISSVEDINVERHAEKESYAGVCDDLKVGVSLIFYLQNMIPYVKAMNSGILPIAGTTLSLSGLSIKGNIILPIAKNEDDIIRGRKASLKRERLLAAARGGDEEAIESLTIDDMDTYTLLSKKIHEDDIFTLVDSYFMPYGVECDQYSVMGEIIECEMIVNKLTEEKVWRLRISCNELSLDICINSSDLYGEPQIGRRFKGVIWLQGTINYPEI